MTDNDREHGSPTPTSLFVRGRLVLDAEEIALLEASVGDDLLVSATLRQWWTGEELPPHSVAVALETQLRMLFGQPPEACALLSAAIDRLAEEFPDDVQRLETG